MNRRGLPRRVPAVVGAPNRRIDRSRDSLSRWRMRAARIARPRLRGIALPESGGKSLKFLHTRARPG
jgi:hypothetical protein